MYGSNILLPAALLFSACSAAPIDQQPLEYEHPVADYPYKKDPYDRKHDTYGDGVQPLPVVSCVQINCSRMFALLINTSAMVTAPAFWDQ